MITRRVTCSSCDSTHHKLFHPLTISTAYVQEETVVPQPSPGDLETPSTYSIISIPSLGNYSGQNDDMSTANTPMVNVGQMSDSGNRLSITWSNRGEISDSQPPTANDRDGSPGSTTPEGRDLQLIPEAPDDGQLNSQFTLDSPLHGQFDNILDGSGDDGSGNNYREMFNRRTERGALLQDQQISVLM